MTPDQLAILIKVREAIQDAHGLLLGNPTDGATQAMDKLRQAASDQLRVIRNTE